MLTSILHSGSFELGNVLIVLGSALFAGLATAILYRICYKETGGFVVTVALLPLLVASVIMIVNGNLGTSVAVLGAFGLIRFRSATGTAREMVFLFFTMAVGLALGMGFITLGAVLFLIGGLMTVALEKSGFASSPSKQRTLKITIPEDLNYNGLFDDLFAKYTRFARLDAVKTTNMGTMYELTYRLEMRAWDQEKAFMDEIRCRNGNLNLTLGLVQRDKNEL